MRHSASMSHFADIVNKTVASDSDTDWTEQGQNYICLQHITIHLINHNKYKESTLTSTCVDRHLFLFAGGTQLPFHVNRWFSIAFGHTGHYSYTPGQKR